MAKSRDLNTHMPCVDLNNLLFVHFGNTGIFYIFIPSKLFRPGKRKAKIVDLTHGNL
jgi:hypothetical protein